MDSTDAPARGELWLVALGAGRAGEPGKTRPAVVVSADELTADSPTDLVVVIPVASSAAPSALRIEIAASTGVDGDSRVMCRAVRSVARGRLAQRIGSVDPTALAQIDAALLLILGLDRTRSGA